MSHVLKIFSVFFVMIFLLYSTLLFHFTRSTLFFLNYLLQISQNHSSIIHSDFENHNVFCNKNKCKVSLSNVASVQYKYKSMITCKNWLKRIINTFFFLNCSYFFFVTFFMSLCLYLFWFPNNIFKLLTITNETWKYFIHSNCHQDF